MNHVGLACALAGVWLAFGCGREDDAAGALSGSGGDAGAPMTEAGSGGQANDEPAVPLGTSSWNITLQSTLSGKGSYPPPSDFTLRIQADGATLGALTIAAQNTMVPLVALDSTPTYSVASDLVLRPVGSWVQRSRIIAVSFRAFDQDGDGIADRIVGSGQGSQEELHGDVVTPAPFVFKLDGIPDTEPPHLETAQATGLSPFASIRLRASEPVSLDSTVVIANGPTSIPLTTESYDDQDLALEYFYTNVLLPFGSSWKASATGTDLAGIPFNSKNLLSLSVMEDPGTTAPDGFESLPLGPIADPEGAAVVDAVGSIPAVNGSKSLWVPDNHSAVLHLTRSPEAHTLRFTARLFQTFQTSSSQARSAVMLGVIGGTQRPTLSLAFPDGASERTGDAGGYFATRVQEFSIPIEDEGADVAVSFDPRHSCPELCGPEYSLLIDDVRIE